MTAVRRRARAGGRQPAGSGTVWLQMVAGSERAGTGGRAAAAAAWAQALAAGSAAGAGRAGAALGGGCGAQRRAPPQAPERQHRRAATWAAWRACAGRPAAETERIRAVRNGDAGALPGAGRGPRRRSQATSYSDSGDASGEPCGRPRLARRTVGESAGRRDRPRCRRP